MEPYYTISTPPSRFSFTIGKNKTSITSSVIHLQLATTSIPSLVCLSCSDRDEICQKVQIIRAPITMRKFAPPEMQTVHRIPVITRDSISLPFTQEDMWTWLKKITSLPDSLLWVANSTLIFIILIIFVRCIICALPSCSKK